MTRSFLIAAGSLMLPVLSSGQIRPDAGQLLQTQLDRKVVPPSPAHPALTPRPRSGGEPAAPGGPRVKVADLRFEGNTVFGQDELRAVLADRLPADYDLAGMKQLAEDVTGFYRAKGYPFARVLVPAQEFQDGILRLRVMEGAYAHVYATGAQFEIAGATPFLAGLRRGELIYGPRLESAMLILDDVPGVAVSPAVSPGAKLETADLAVAVRMDERAAGQVGVDNHGSRFTGRQRLRGHYHANGALRFGDQLSLDALTTNHAMFLGALAYEQPWGGSGLRGKLSVSRTGYALAEDYATLGISGFAEVYAVEMSRPLLRSQARSLHLSLSFQHKVLQDEFSAIAVTENKSSEVLLASLRFDQRDSLGEGGVTFGVLAATLGRLRLQGALAVNDAATAGKAGDFSKLTLDLARAQNLGGIWSLHGRLSGQLAGGNLDSSEKTVAGGPDGVRAYPMGEASGDQGWLAQVELRCRIGGWAPYAFHDACSVRTNRRPWDANSDLRRDLAGTGLGVRWSGGPWSADVAAAWRGRGGAAQSDGSFGRVTGWFSVGRSF